MGTSRTWHRSLSSACHISRFCCSWCLLVSSRTWNTSPLQLTVAPHVSLISTKLTRINVVMTQFIATYEGFENPAMRATTQPVRGELLRRDLNQTVAEAKTSKKGKPESNKTSRSLSRTNCHLNILQMLRDEWNCGRYSVLCGHFLAWVSWLKLSMQLCFALPYCDFLAGTIR